MGKYKYGVIKSEVGTYNEVDGTSTGWAEIEPYKDTIVITEEDPTTTNHFKQGDANPKITRQQPGAQNIELSIMDLSADSKVMWLGGTKTTVSTKETWNAPKVKTPKIKSLRFTLETGEILTIPKVSCFGKLDFKASDTDIDLITVSGVIQDPGFAGVAPMMIADPE
ncbi:hypothetical protein Pedsa_0943 [Pseudopedobacter saltans DSM 12145]|uniref:Phage tail protein n=1 Tax=Pseudopedobacter saltans (strain ATCC 51119 / DSM 12145 / JCM 21818 / CCUG 39354 / LMG 10337 / NBRC 100064 / NCIMB 13643) TaxID=762903 RepID=F0SAD8_PSESL|nr:hypothetical protein [Pseudopedobacter saltans]ADY51515.1 hypothetical protein Pedsa_0943 [Pseudopedobacter saltans DSM 12145]